MFSDALSHLMHCADPCDSTAIELGNDVCLCTVWQLCGMRRSWQHLFNLQSEDAGRQCTREPRALGSQWISLVLPVSWWQPDSHQLRRHDLVSDDFDDLFVYHTLSECFLNILFGNVGCTVVY